MSENCLVAIKENIKKRVKGKDDIIELLLVSLVCSGHVILEDLPGLGKTTIASALAESLGCDFQRIQFTPDVLPSDITGFNTLDMKTGEEIFHKGSVHNQIILADEINRASPKTQSALLEAMQEGQVTVDGTTYPLPKPFMILATQNPIDMSGTYPLPEAQMDRFLMQLSVGYPTKEDERNIVLSNRNVTEKIVLSPVATAEEIINIQNLIKDVHIEEQVLDYILNIVSATRNFEGVITGSSPRGSIALTNAACGLAILRGRSYVLPDDVKYLAPYVLAHRLILKNRIGSKAITATGVIEEIIKSLPVPKIR